MGSGRVAGCALSARYPLGVPRWSTLCDVYGVVWFKYSHFHHFCVHTVCIIPSKGVSERMLYIFLRGDGVTRSSVYF